MGIEMRASLLAGEDASRAIKGRFKRARLLPERLAAGCEFAENFSERRRSSFRGSRSESFDVQLHIRESISHQSPRPDGFRACAQAGRIPE